MLYDTTFLLFCRMLYNVVLVWPPQATLLYSVLLARGQWKQFSRHISLLTGRTEIKKLFSLQTSSVMFLQSLPWLCFLMFLTCVRLLVLQSSDEESEVGHFVMVIENLVYLEYFRRNVVSCCTKC